MNNAPTMKQQPSASALRPSRLCQILLVALALKISIVGSMAYEALFSAQPASTSVAFAAASTAPAPTGAAPAPDSIQAPVGVLGPGSGPGYVPGSATGSSYAPGTTAPTRMEGERALPGIGTRTGIGTGGEASQQNATVSNENLAREALARRQDELARKEEELRNLEKEITGRLEELQVLESRLQIMMRDAQGTADSKVRHLVDVLGNMKARQAAQVIETLDLGTAVKILTNMRGKIAGEILTHVNSERAAALAESLARMQMPLE